MAPKEYKQTLVAPKNSESTRLSIDDVALVVTEGPHTGLEYRFEQEIVRIGRAEWCELVLAQDHWASSIHCECWMDESGVRIRDLGSRNGIVLNGCRVFDAYLSHGSIFRIGSSSIQLKPYKGKKEIAIKYRDESGILVGKSRPMRQIFTMLSKLATRKVSVLLTGETGTGKTSIARALHAQSGDPSSPFVVVNCGALAAGLIEGELFGYEKGAFTGANSRHLGFFEQADGGTLFLDEIGELPLELQPKLLDVLERKRIRRLGSEREEQADFRLICATHRHLPTDIEAGRFREDLFFRISIVDLEVPPLRTRREDIPLLVTTLLQELVPEQTPMVSNEAFDALMNYLWPGNIRQLRNVLERSVTFLEGHLIQPHDLSLPNFSDELSREAPPPAQAATSTRAFAPETRMISEDLLALPLKGHSDGVVLKSLLVDVEKFVLIQALEECEGNVQEASTLLHISPAWLYNRMKKYDIKKPKG